MVRRGFATAAARQLGETPGGSRRVASLETGIDAIERGIARRSRHVVAPRWVGPLLPIRMLAQRAIDLATRAQIQSVLETARAEDAPLTTPQPALAPDWRGARQ